MERVVQLRDVDRVVRNAVLQAEQYGRMRHAPGQSRTVEPGESSLLRVEQDVELPEEQEAAARRGALLLQPLAVGALVRGPVQGIGRERHATHRGSDVLHYS